MDTVSTQASQTVEFKGHLFDSLTLSKVADQILQRGADYRLNDVRIGTARHDFSSVSLTVLADDAQKLARLLEDLKVYGATPVGGSATLSPCPAAGQLPADAVEIRLPARVRVQGNWLALDGGNHALTIVVDPASSQARLAAVDTLAEGDLVVCGSQGVEW